jgi:uncharacterized protein (TIGR01319 family)
MTAYVQSLGRADDYLEGRKPWHRALLLDVGSTFTKAMVIAPSGQPLARSEASTTIDDDVMSGVASAIGALPEAARGPYDWALASSSAAGGLRMASIGLTAPLSGRAGDLAALGAGAKVVASEHGMLDDEALARIEAATPHLVLLSGGLDGGNAEALRHNAAMLQRLHGPWGYVIAGNARVADEAAETIRNGNRDVRIVDNVFPRAGEIAITATREAVRDLFLRHITKAKGLDGLMAALRTECEPTPLAVSRSLGYLADEGPVVVVDLGGATTDVHSLGGVRTERRAAELPEPETMRTVEGDLGMRWGAPGTVEAMGEAARQRAKAGLNCDLVAEAARRHDDPAFLPSSAFDRTVDRSLAEAAVAIALERHAGKVVVRHRPWGDRYHVTGKDLRPCRVLVATGGAFRHADDATALTSSALASIDGAQVPVSPAIEIDQDYSLYAIGLLARLSPGLARALAAQALKPADQDFETKEAVAQ